MGLRPDDFMGMDRDEFEAASESFADHEEQAERSRWERTRTLGLMALQPWSKGRLNAEKVLPFPWDDEAKTAEACHTEEAPRLTKEERRRRMEEARRLLGERYRE